MLYNVTYIYKQNIDGPAQMDPPRKCGIPPHFFDVLWAYRIG